MSGEATRLRRSSCRALIARSPTAWCTSSTRRMPARPSTVIQGRHGERESMKLPVGQHSSSWLVSSTGSPLTLSQNFAATFTVRIGYADAHRKNLSLLHEPPGVVRLAPLYDTVPTALSPNLPRRAAMTINNRGYLADVTIADIAAEATR